MATRRSWLATICLVVLTIQLTALQVEGFKGKKDKKHDYDDCCCNHCYDPCCDPCHDPCRDSCYDPCYHPYYYYGGKGKHGYGKNKYGHNYYDCCDCCCDCCCEHDKKKGKKDDKGWKKIMKKDKGKSKCKCKDKHKGKGKGKCKSHGCDECCDGQTVIVRNGPAIIQTIIVDKDVYSKYCRGCYGNNPLQKVCLQDDHNCHRYPTKYTCHDNFDPQSFRVVTQDPCRNYNPCSYSHY